MTPLELKNSILQLAIQGKLVDQRPEEGTAEELYRQIQAEKQALIKAGKIKKEKPLPEITGEEMPFDIPESWMWVRLGDYAQKITDQVASGSFASLRENVPSLKEPDYAIMVKTADFSNGFTRNLTYTTRHGYEFLENSNLFGGELILSNIGSIGKCFIVPYLDHRMTLAPNAVMVRLISDDHRDYLYNFILSPLGYAELMSITSGTAMKKFNKTDLKTILVPIPPLAEQKRIVAKIEELLPLIDRYEDAWTRLEAFNKRFPSDMQKSLLQLAIQGKLVDQRPEEGTGEDLYRQIQAEKQSLIRSGKLKKEKPLPEITDDEIPFDIPESWKWIKLGTVASVLGGKRIPAGRKLTNENTGHIYIRVSDMKNGSVLTGNLLYVPSDIYPSISRYIINKEDVYITVAGTIGAVGTVPPELDGANLTENADRLVFSNIDQAWLVRCLQSFLVQNQIAGATTKVGQPKLAIMRIQELIIPLPPLAEQKRIVAKLESLLPLCSRLQ